VSLRASDSDRERVVEVLREHAVDGRLTLEEFSERIEQAYLARTHDALDELTLDLPNVAAPRRRRTKALLALFSSNRCGGRVRIGRRVVCAAMFGEIELDLRQATIERDVTTIVVLASLAEVDVYVPEGVEVDLRGLAILAEKRLRGRDAAPRRGTPLVRVVVLASLAQVTVWHVPLDWAKRSTREVTRGILEELEA
jgi:hypothetical protein